MKLSRSLFLIWTCCLSGIVEAGDWHSWRPGYQAEATIHRLLERQHWRIEQGAASGQLTRKEFRKLMRKHRRLVELEQDFSRDGWLSSKEIRVLHHKIHRLDDKLIRKLHNHKRRPPPRCYRTDDDFHPWPYPFNPPRLPRERSYNDYRTYRWFYY